MKKILLVAALFSLSCLSASANWLTGESTILAVNGGEAAFHLSLSSNQMLDANLASASSSADVIFTNKSTKENLSLSSLPLSLSDASDAVLTITPLINDSNGSRFYLISTGTHDGAHIVSYSKGNFKDIFSSASLPDETGSAAFDVSKKDILLIFTSSAGTSTYKLTYSSKDGTFTANKA